MRRGVVATCIFLGAVLLAHCGGDATFEEGEPVAACSCSDGTERETRCTCVGGSSFKVSGGGIEFDCEGNAGCELSCGEDCLIVCPGTTSCDVTAGDRAEVRCPGTASCDITCEGSCAVEVAGAADVVVRCQSDPSGAACQITGCSPEDCGDSVYACGTSCPASP